MRENSTPIRLTTRAGTLQRRRTQRASLTIGSGYREPALTLLPGLAYTAAREGGDFDAIVTALHSG